MLNHPQQLSLNQTMLHQQKKKTKVATMQQARIFCYFGFSVILSSVYMHGYRVKYPCSKYQYADNVNFVKVLSM